MVYFQKQSVIVPDTKYVFLYKNHFYKGMLTTIETQNNNEIYKFEDIIDLENGKCIDMQDINEKDYILSKKTIIYELTCAVCDKEVEKCKCCYDRD